MAAKDDYLIDTLVDMGVLMSSDIEGARAEADSTGEGIIDTLVKNGVLASSQVATAKAAQLGVEFIPLGEMQIGDDAIAAIPRHIAKRFNVVPVYKTEMGVIVALADPSDLDTLDGLSHSINMEVEPRVATPEDIEAALNRYYGGSGAGAERTQHRHRHDELRPLTSRCERACERGKPTNSKHEAGKKHKGETTRLS